MTKYSKTEVAEAKTNLHKWIKPGDIVYTVLASVSRSGMSRNIRVLLLRPDRKSPGGVCILEPGYAVAAVLGYKLAKRGDGIMVGGCGMDMGFHIVYSLGRSLWPNGTSKPHGTRNGQPDRDGGYALKHKWL